MNISRAIREGIKRANKRTPDSVNVTMAASGAATAMILTRDKHVQVRNFVVKVTSGQAKATVWVRQAGGPPSEYTVSGGTIQELIMSVAMGVALGAYDV